MTGPDNPMTLPLRWWEMMDDAEQAEIAATDRTLDALAGDDPLTELEIGEYPGERDHLNHLLRLAAKTHMDNAEIAAAARDLVRAVIDRRDADYWMAAIEVERAATRRRIEAGR